MYYEPDFVIIIYLCLVTIATQVRSDKKKCEMKDNSKKVEILLYSMHVINSLF